MAHSDPYSLFSSLFASHRNPGNPQLLSGHNIQGNIPAEVKLLICCAIQRSSSEGRLQHGVVPFPSTCIFYEKMWYMDPCRPTPVAGGWSALQNCSLSLTGVMMATLLLWTAYRGIARGFRVVNVSLLKINTPGRFCWHFMRVVMKLLGAWWRRMGLERLNFLKCRTIFFNLQDFLNNVFNQSNTNSNPFSQKCWQIYPNPDAAQARPGWIAESNQPRTSLVSTSVLERGAMFE